jgi:allantoin racemase
VLFVNPNASQACTAGIAGSIASLRTDAVAFDVVGCAEGPAAIYSWRDWHAAVAPLCRTIAAMPADAYVIACASDPGFEAAHEVTDRPVLGLFRSAVAEALAASDRFGVIALADASIDRHALTLRGLGVHNHLADEIAMNLPMDTLLDPSAAREALLATARSLRARGAGAIILGCTGMAGHADAIASAVGVLVIEPCQAAARAARAALEFGGAP